ncbi:acetate--CoA ligase family protein [Rhizomonospora bruguierae]|uniref:acetate--CoA ligase family protein n=1 Tax=Rhizomonospora bruguierae TaxID=1581705 RepID=UPI0035E40302
MDGGGVAVARLLAGYRGRPPLAVGEPVDLVVTVSRLAAAHPRILALDLNPVLVTADGVLALDAHWEP